MKKRLLSLVLCLVMVFSLLPFAGFAAQEPVTANGATIVNPDTAYTTRRDLVLNKNLTANADGTFDLKLETFATGKVTTSVVTHQIPTDFILVVDQSGSMAYADMPTDFQPADHTGSWKLSDFDGGKDTDGNSADKEYYFLDQNTGDYYRVYRKWGDVFERVPRNTVYSKDIVDSRNLTWFRDEVGTESDFNSQYYYQPASDINITRLCAGNDYIQPGGENDYNFYPLTISSQGRTFYYSIRLNYYDSTGTKRYLRFTNNPANNSANKDLETGYCIWYRDPSGNRFGPGDRYLAIFSYNAGIGIDCNDFVLDWIDGNANWDSFYTYGRITGAIQSGMYIQNTMFIRHVNYNALAYRDANGVEHIIASTDYCNHQGVPVNDQFATSEFSFNVPLYEAKGAKESRLQAAKNAMTAFVQNVAAQTDDEGPVDHRVAIIGFSSSGYSNTELMTNEGWTVSNNDGIASPSTQQYQKALISARANDDGDVNPALTAAITNLTANGGTQPEDGLNMAYNALNNSSKKPEYTSRERNAVVIFFTDGRPGQNSESDQYKEANDVVASAYTIKSQIPNAQIYSVGVFGEADGNPLTYYEALTNWIGFSTSDVFLEKDRLLEDFANANNGRTEYGEVSPSFGNYKDYVRDYAENIYYPDFYKEEGTKSTRTFTFRWREGLSLGYNRSWQGTGYIHNISGTFWREAIRNKLGYPAQQNDTIADYMTVVSSTYPVAKTFTYRSGNTNGFRNYTGSSTYNEIIGAARGSAVNKMYYSLCTNSERLTEVFVNIAESIDTAGTTIDLDGSAQLRDIVNTDVFEMPANANAVTAYAVSASARNENGNIIYTFGNNHEQDFTPTVTDDTVSVSGFDYSSHYVMPTPPAGITGQKLVVEIKGLTLKDAVNGTVPSNDEAGIYATKIEDGQTVISTEPTLDIDSPTLTINGGEKTYIIDFGAEMIVANNAKQVKQLDRADGKSNGTFNLKGEQAVYQLKSKDAENKFNVSFSGVDNAMVFGVPAGTTGDRSWNKITTVPANNIYFDDQLGTLTATENNSGRNTGVTNASSVGDNGTVLTNGTYADPITFTVTGSRVDIYCTTESTSGTVIAQVWQGETLVKSLNTVMSNRFDGEQNGEKFALYNVPTLSFDLPDSTNAYTVKITTNGTSNYKIDGVRVYKAVDETNTDVKSAYLAANEANSFFLKVRDQLLAGARIDLINAYLEAKRQYDNAEDKTGMTEPVAPDESELRGVMFYMDSVSENDGTNLKKTAEYSKMGPKNEIYLAKNEGLSFAIMNAPTDMKVWIGLSAPQGTASGSVKINGAAYEPAISNAVDMYYPVSVKAGNVIEIQNVGDALISVTNVKITGSALNGTPGATVLSVADVESAASVLSAEDGLPYLAVTPKLLAELNAPEQAEDPQPTADPEPTPTQPGFAEWISNLFSSFVNALFGSIARLFGN